MLRVVQGNCHNCQELCENEKKIVCYREDETCAYLMAEKCKNMCLMRYCEAFKKKRERKKRERKLLDINVAGDRYQIILSRAKAHQRLRNMYDETKENQLREKVFQENRRKIIDSINQAEEELYYLQNQVYVKQDQKSSDFE